MTTPFRFGVSQFTTWPWSFEQDVENYARPGIETIEVCESKLDDGRAEEQLALVESCIRQRASLTNNWRWSRSEV